MVRRIESWAQIALVLFSLLTGVWYLGWRLGNIEAKLEAHDKETAALAERIERLENRYLKQ